MSEVTSYHLTGDWRHVVDDALVDPDALPDEVLPTGHVEFIPLAPQVAVSGSPDTAYTLASFKSLIADGVLTDLQGREGVQIAGKIGDSLIRWRAVTHLEYMGTKIAYPTVEFTLDGDARLTGILDSGVPVQPITIYNQRIEDLTDQAEGYRDEVLVALEGVEGLPEILGALEAYDGYPVDWQEDDAALRTEILTIVNGKANSNHTHAISGVTGLQSALNSKLDESQVDGRVQIGVDSLVDAAPGTLNTLNELAQALGDDPNFATTVANSISGKASVNHTHPVADLTATGTASSSTYLRGDGSWATPANTTYSVMSEAEATAGTASTARTMSAARLTGAIQRWATGSAATAISAIGQALNRAATAAEARDAIGAAADNHAHPVTDLTATGTRSSSTYLRGDGSWATPTNSTYSVPTQAEAEAGTATTGRAFSAQRVRQAADAAITARVQLVSEFPASPVAGVLYLKAED